MKTVGNSRKTVGKQSENSRKTVEKKVGKQSMKTEYENLSN